MGAPRTLHAHHDWALHVALSGSGGAVLSTGLDGAVLDGRRLYSAAARQCALSGDGKRAALACRDGVVRVYDRARRAEVVDASFSGALPEACGVALGPDGVAAGCFTSGSRHAVTVRGCGGASTTRLEFGGVGRGVTMSGDGRRVGFVADVGRAVLADVSRLHDDVLRVEVRGDVGQSADSRGVVWGVADADALRVIDVRSGHARPVAGYHPPGKYGRCGLSSDARRVVAAERGGFGVWDLRRDDSRFATLRTGSGGFCNGCAITPAGDAVLTAATDGQVRLWGLIGDVGRFVRRRETTEDVRWWRTSRAIMRCS